MPKGAKKRKAEKKKKEQLGITGTDHTTSHGAHHHPFAFPLSFFDLHVRGFCFFFC